MESFQATATPVRTAKTAAQTRAHLTEIRVMAVKLLHQHGLTPSWGFKWDGARRRAGCCNYTDKVISLSRPLMSIWTVEQARLTILHEIAHALTPGHHHDRVWQLKCAEIGGDAKRTWDQRAEVPPSLKSKYVGTCPAGHESTRERLPKPGLKVSCGRCSRRYNPAYLITWKLRAS